MLTFLSIPAAARAAPRVGAKKRAAPSVQYSDVDGNIRIAAREQKPLRPCQLPVGAQNAEQLRRQHHIAILAAFAMLDANDQPPAVDAAHLDADDFGRR